jgi:hypothetical protein
MDKAKKVDLVEEARQLRLQAEDLEKRVQLGRGTARMRRPTRNLQANVIVKPAYGPHWVGDDGTTQDLMSAIHRLLMERPHTFQEILDATGARDNRVKGAITALQREGTRVVDIAPEGTRKALWFVPSDEVLKRVMRAKRATAERK